eukprot:2413419-Rhodomonas_salina.1
MRNSVLRNKEKEKRNFVPQNDRTQSILSHDGRNRHPGLARNPGYPGRNSSPSRGTQGRGTRVFENHHDTLIPGYDNDGNRVSKPWASLSFSPPGPVRIPAQNTAWKRRPETGAYPVPQYYPGITTRNLVIVTVPVYHAQ